MMMVGREDTFYRIFQSEASEWSDTEEPKQLKKELLIAFLFKTLKIWIDNSTFYRNYFVDFHWTEL